MALDQELLDIILCPVSQGELHLVDLPADVSTMLVEKYREHFRDEEPVANQGLLCHESGLLYPVISDIPMLLRDEALSASVLGDAAAAE